MTHQPLYPYWSDLTIPLLNSLKFKITFWTLLTSVQKLTDNLKRGLCKLLWKGKCKLRHDFTLCDHWLSQNKLQTKFLIPFCPTVSSQHSYLRSSCDQREQTRGEAQQAQPALFLAKFRPLIVYMNIWGSYFRKRSLTSHTKLPKLRHLKK